MILELERQPRPRSSGLFVPVAAGPPAGPGLDRGIDLDRDVHRLQLGGLVQALEGDRRLQRPGLRELDDLELVDRDLVAQVRTGARHPPDRRQDRRDDCQSVPTGRPDQHGGHPDLQVAGGLSLGGERVVGGAALDRPRQKVGGQRPELTETEQDGADGIDVLGRSEVAGGAGVVGIQTGVVQLAEGTTEPVVDVAERTIDRDPLVPARGHRVAGLLEAAVDDAHPHGRSHLAARARRTQVDLAGRRGAVPPGPRALPSPRSPTAKPRSSSDAFSQISGSSPTELLALAEDVGSSSVVPVSKRSSSAVSTFPSLMSAPWSESAKNTGRSVLDAFMAEEVGDPAVAAARHPEAELTVGLHPGAVRGALVVAGHVDHAVDRGGLVRGVELRGLRSALIRRSRRLPLRPDVGLVEPLVVGLGRAGDEALG